MPQATSTSPTPATTASDGWTARHATDALQGKTLPPPNPDCIARAHAKAIAQAAKLDFALPGFGTGTGCHEAPTDFGGLLDSVELLVGALVPPRHLLLVGSGEWGALRVAAAIRPERRHCPTMDARGRSGRCSPQSASRRRPLTPAAPRRARSASRAR